MKVPSLLHITHKVWMENLKEKDFWEYHGLGGVESSEGGCKRMGGNLKVPEDRQLKSKCVGEAMWP